MITIDEVRRLLPVPPVAVMTAAYSGQKLSPAEAIRIFETLIVLSEHDLLSHQDRALCESSGVQFTRELPGGSPAPSLSANEKKPVVKLSHYKLFANAGNSVCRINAALSEDFTLSNKSKRSVNFTIERLSAALVGFKDTKHTLQLFSHDAMEIRFPQNGTLKRGGKEKITATVTPFRPGVCQDVLLISLDSGLRIFLTVSLIVEPALFGVAIEYLTCSPFPPFRTTNRTMCPVPDIFAHLVEGFFEGECHLQEGPFRKPGNSEDIQWLKQQLNSGNEIDWRSLCARDPAVVPSVMKVWLRELPRGYKLLGSFTEDSLDLFAHNRLPFSDPQPGTFLLYFLSFMAEVCSFEKVNRMSARAMATVLAPNLYEIAEGEPPTLDLMIVDRVRQWLENQLVKLLQETAGNNIPS